MATTQHTKRSGVRKRYGKSYAKSRAQLAAKDTSKWDESSHMRDERIVRYLVLLSTCATSGWWASKSSALARRAQGGAIATCLKSRAAGYYEHPRLIEGMINEDSADIAKYIGSSTGTSHNQEICSPYRSTTCAKS